MNGSKASVLFYSQKKKFNGALLPTGKNVKTDVGFKIKTEKNSKQC